MWNLIGVLTSSGAVAFTILSLLPVELILQVGTGAGFAMVFALLIAAIIWNLGTWWLGLPASSSHTLIGSIIGVGIANQLMSPSSGTSGVDWAQAGNVFKVLLISPLVGFGVAGAPAARCSNSFVKNPALYKSPEGDAPPPFWIRAPAHPHLHRRQLRPRFQRRSKGHGPHHAHPDRHRTHRLCAEPRCRPRPGAGFRCRLPAGARASSAMHLAERPSSADPRNDLTDYIRTKDAHPDHLAAAHRLALRSRTRSRRYKSLAGVPANQQQNVRNDMYVESEALRLIAKSGKPAFTPPETAELANYKKQLDNATKFIPRWVKVAVALALGLGTMVGWKRIVVTVGEKIGKEHLTYAQGASAEIIAAITIIAADNYHMPVSTTHVLSSGVAGTMVANGSGLQLSTIRNIALAWVFTLPAAALLSAGLFFLMRQFM